MAFPTGYTKYQELTIDYTQVSADLTDFVVYVDLSDFDTSTDIFDTCRSDGGDIRVTKSDGTTELAREIVAINTSAKTGEIYIKYAGTLSSSVNTVIRIWYNGTDTEPGSTDTYGSENVWTSYNSVHHMNGTAASAAKADNSEGTSGQDLLETGSPTAATGWNGQANGAYSYDGSMRTETTDDPAVATTGSISSWIYADNLSADRFIHGVYAGSLPTRIFLFRVDAAGSIFFLKYGSTNSTVTSSNTFSAGAWAHITATWSPSVVKIYLNGTGTTGTTGAGFTTGASAARALCSGSGANNATEFVGDNDEMRYTSTVEFSADWIATEYINQSAPNTFYSVGAEQGAGGSTQPARTPRHIWW